MKTKLMIYGCGGTGLNLLQDVIEHPNLPTQSPVDAVRIDLSNANERKECPLPNYSIPGTGAGKDRALALEQARPHIDDILKSHLPGTTNVVLFSAAGGTGSVVGPLIIAELMRRGHPVVAFVVGSTLAGKHCKNTHKTLLTLQRQVNSNKVPLSIAYYENAENAGNCDRKGTRPEVDDVIAKDIYRLSLLSSEAHRELDRSDFNNFLDYRKVTDVPAQLTEILFGVVGGEKASDFDVYKGSVISSVTVLPSKADSALDLGQPYSAEGFYQEEVLEEYGDSAYGQCAILTTLNLNTYMDQVLDRLKHLEEVEEGLKRDNGFRYDDSADADDDVII